MENIIRNIIKEELKRALLEIQKPMTVSGEDEIIYNFEAGRAFGINKLANEIYGLKEYYMNDYFPHSEMEESWMFEIQTHYNSSQLIEITHRLSEDLKSYWKLDISDVGYGENNVPEISHTTGFIRDYDNFIQTVNSSLQKAIDPNFL